MLLLSISGSSITVNGRPLWTGGHELAIGVAEDLADESKIAEKLTRLERERARHRGA